MTVNILVNIPFQLSLLYIISYHHLGDIKALRKKFTAFLNNIDRAKETPIAIPSYPYLVLDSKPKMNVSQFDSYMYHLSCGYYCHN